MFNQYPYINENDLNLDYILKRVKELIAAVDGLEKWRSKHEKEYKQLYAWYDSLVKGDLSPELIAAINKWCRENIISIVGELVHMVFFSIDTNGYFVAHIPESWHDIIFGTTGYDDFPAGIDYGHLTLSY